MNQKKIDTNDTEIKALIELSHKNEKQIESLQKLVRLLFRAIDHKAPTK